MSGYDEILIEVLDDGTIRSENGKISGPNHHNASQLFNMLAELAGGKVQRTKRQPGHVHIKNTVEQKEG